MNALVPAIQQAFSQSRAVVLAVVVETKGSTYRKSGARMLLIEQGQLIGLISGGCLENDLQMHAKRVFSDGKSRIVEYDMREEEQGSWSLALGCNGLVNILLQRFESTDACPWLKAQLSAAHTRQCATLITEIAHSKNHELLHLIWPSEGSKKQQVSEPFTGFASQIELFQKTARVNKQQTQILQSPNNNRRFLVENIKPPINILVCGAGPDIEPLAKLMAMQGWQTTIVDHRGAYIAKAQAIICHQLLKVQPEQLKQQCDFGNFDGLVIISHSNQADKNYLQQAVEFVATKISNDEPLNCLSYAGVLGPAKRTQNLFDLLQNDLSEDAMQKASNWINNIHSPIGLDLGGEGAEAIALSIVAQMQSVFSQKTAVALSTQQ